jgi:hypothetical protein
VCGSTVGHPEYQLHLDRPCRILFTIQQGRAPEWNHQRGSSSSSSNNNNNHLIGELELPSLNPAGGYAPIQIPKEVIDF